MKAKEMRIVFKPSAMEVMKRECASSYAEGLETGGHLLGTRTAKGIGVHYALGPGKNAVRTAGRFEPDYSHTAAEFKRLNKSGKLTLLGVWHLHPLDGLSGGDIDTLKAVCTDHPDFLAVIAKQNNQGFKFRAFTVRNSEIIELPWEVEKSKKKKQSPLDYTRTAGISPHPILARKVVTIVGLGSASRSLLELTRAGIEQFNLVDNEVLEKVNLVRHEGKYFQVGMPKVDIAALEITAINPNAKVNKELLKLEDSTEERIEELVKKSHLVISSSGNPRANQCINVIGRKYNKPIIFGGIFEKAAGGFAMLHVPSQRNSPCFNCVYDYSKLLNADSNEEIRATAKRYGISEEQLAAHQGMYVDISFVTLLLTKMALLTLLRGSKHELGTLPGNFVLWNSRTMETKWIQMKRRKDCAVCNPDGFVLSKVAASREKGIPSLDIRER